MSQDPNLALSSIGFEGARLSNRQGGRTSEQNGRDRGEASREIEAAGADALQGRQPIFARTLRDTETIAQKQNPRNYSIIPCTYG